MARRISASLRGPTRTALHFPHGTREESFVNDLLLRGVWKAASWLGRQDSNLRIQESKSCVLPLDDFPRIKSAKSSAIM